MPSKRRGGGFGPPELRGTLGTLLRTTTGVVRDALERGAREGRARLDGARANRQRQDALADLGELVLDLIRRGEIDLAELPEARDLIRQLDELDADPDDDSPPPPPPRSRASSRRSSIDDRAAPRSRPSGPAADDDGTVSSGAAAADRTMRPTIPARPKHADPASTRAPTKPIKGLWRPRLDDDEPAPTRTPARGVGVGPAAAAADRPDPRRPPLPHDPQRKGGISFDDDDLDDYMHPDDVPAKPARKPTDPDDGEA
jgi:hypothetical protein